MKIAINKPCHEDWTKMTPNEQGVFCNVCTKNVVDFTSKTLEEIKSFFSKPIEGSVCARFKEEQLEGLNVESFVEKFIAFKFTRKVAVIVALSVVGWLAGINEARAQSGYVKGKPGVSPTEQVVPPATTNTVVPQTKVGIVMEQKDTTKCTKEPKTTKDPKTGKGAQSTKKPKGKSNSTNTAITDPKKEEKFIMGDVAP